MIYAAMYFKASTHKNCVFNMCFYIVSDASDHIELLNFFTNRLLYFVIPKIRTVVTFYQVSEKSTIEHQRLSLQFQPHLLQ